MFPILAKIDPQKIVIDPDYVVPTDWDKKAITDDLNDYVQLSRMINGTPVVRIVRGTLVLVSGEPFVRAALNVEPPLQELACLVDNDEESVRSFGLNVRTATELLDEVPANARYDAVELLGFTRSLSAPEKEVVEARLKDFFDDVSANPSVYGGSYSSMSHFEWDEQGRKVHWSWRRTDQFGQHSFLFLNLLSDLHHRIAPLSSWNGLTPPLPA